MKHSVTNEGDHLSLHVAGELDALTCSDLRPTLDSIAEQSGRNVTVDLQGLRLIDSSGVGALVSLYKRVRAKGGNVEFVNVANQPLAIFKLLRLDLVFGLDVSP
ncbi:MAG: STAS domain-containing protein [Myxococcales bacterium]|nr:STAS domain-containing protein [Myxococcales bacterium]MCB9583131.1 STAS domain-containing protein [Polyangiaceae bacterium]